MKLFLLAFLSGFSALVYEVLWLKELGLVFGSAVDIREPRPFHGTAEDEEQHSREPARDEP